MIIISFKFLKWGANTELTTQTESPGQRAKKREGDLWLCLHRDSFSVTCPNTRMVEEWRTVHVSKTSNFDSTTTFYPVPLPCPWGKKPLMLSSPNTSYFSVTGPPQVLVTEAEAVTWNTHLYKPSVFFLVTQDNSLSHVENAPSHIGQMQGLKKEVTFILEFMRIISALKNVTTLEFAELANVQMERRWQNPLCSIWFYPDYSRS